MCYGFATGSPGTRGRSPGGFRVQGRPNWAFHPATKVKAPEGAIYGDFSRDSLALLDGFGAKALPEGTPDPERPAGFEGDLTMAAIRPDSENGNTYAKQRPKRAAPKKGAKGGGGAADKSAGGGSGGGTGGGSAPSPSGSGTSSSGAGSPGGEPPGGGKGPGKSPPSSPVSVSPSPKKRPRRSRRKEQVPSEEAPDVMNQTADDAAAALAAIEGTSSTSVSTLKSHKDVRAATAAARREAREKLKAEAEKKAKEAREAAQAAAAAGMPPPPPFSKPTASAISKAGTKAVSSASAVAASPSTPSSYPQYKCGQNCQCNSYGREKLRELESTSGEAEHCRENLHFIRWSQLRRDNAELKEQVKANRELLVAQKAMLEEILQHSKDAATVRASVDLAADDKGELGMPWTDMDQSVMAFSTMAKRQMLYRVLHRVVCKACHFPRKAMLEMFAPELQQRVYPIAKPNTHSRRSSAWRYGKKYHILPEVTLDFIAFVMSKKYTEFTSALASQEVKDHLNDARETAKDKDKEEFFGHLDEPVYLLVWRDSEAKCFVIEETPPFDGDEEAKDAFVARWEEAVNDAIADKYPNGFLHKNPPRPRTTPAP